MKLAASEIKSMKLEDQVCSLEQAKKLKQLAVPQKSAFYWSWYHQESDKKWEVTFGSTNESWYSAFTVAELGDMLPRDYCSKKLGKRWGIFDGDVCQEVYEPSEADARAKCSSTSSKMKSFLQRSRV